MDLLIFAMVKWAMLLTDICCPEPGGRGGGGDTSIVRGRRSSDLGSNLEQNL